jgi:carboxymethylenebutenolidase
MAQDVSVQVDDATMKIYVAEPDGAAKGAIVVLQEAFGVNDHIRDLCHRIAEAGYVAAAPHLFHRSGDPELGYDDMMECVPYISGLQVNALEADLAATLELLKGKGFEGKKVGVTGWCMGGSVAFLAAAYWDLGAAVSWYGGGITQGRFGMPPLIDLAPTLQTPWLGLFGDNDASIPTDQVDALKATAAEKAKVATDVVRYEGADHGFNCNQRGSYHEASATDGWARMLAFFGEHVG